MIAFVGGVAPWEVLMKHRASVEDQQFRRAFEGQKIEPAAFDHPAHVRLAYVYLCEDSVDGAVEKMRRALLAFLTHLGADLTKYHETITRAWVLAVDHFMNQSAACTSYEDLALMNPQLLDSKIMLTHYSAEVLFSAEARLAFVAPDLQPIPPA
jgi:hypothetical protein